MQGKWFGVGAKNSVRPFLDNLCLSPPCTGEQEVGDRNFGFHCDRESDDDQLSDTDEPYFIIGVVAIEHDAGTPEEAEEKVRNIIKAIEEKFDQAAAAFGSPVDGGSEGADKLRFQVEIANPNIFIG
jgi:hypothetical protein